jgi:hypothetical protein
VALCTGCSFFTSLPHRNDRNEIVCRDTHELTAIDGLAATASATYASVLVIGTKLDDGPSSDLQGVAYVISIPFFAIAAIYAASTVRGVFKVRRCQRARALPST